MWWASRCPFSGLSLFICSVDGFPRWTPWAPREVLVWKLTAGRAVRGREFQLCRQAAERKESKAAMPRLIPTPARVPSVLPATSLLHSQSCPVAPAQRPSLSTPVLRPQLLGLWSHCTCPRKPVSARVRPGAGTTPVIPTEPLNVRSTPIHTHWRGVVS